MRPVEDAKVRYMVPAWGVILLVLYGFLATAVLFVGGFSTVQARREYFRARNYSIQVDSLMKDWVSRGCVPRVSSLP